jgi:diguanylate cyclase (GGDEF)-like protein
MRKHPLSTYIFVWCCDITAIIIFIFSLMNMPRFSTKTWIDFFIWAGILCLARFGGFFKFTGLKASTGWGTTIELTGALILPFSLYSTIIYLSAIIIMANRVLRKNSEPFLGPDFNASNTILAALIMMLVRDKIHLLIPVSVFWSIIPLILESFIFASCQITLLTMLMTIDSGIKWKKVGTLSIDSLRGEFILIISGAILGRIYQLEPFLILIMIIPLILLHGILEKSNEAKLIYIDEKTGLYNYRFFDNKLSELYKKASHSHKAFTIIFGDMDRLRDVNNTYGHQIGDKALIAVAKVLKSSLRDNSLAIRFGGEEFIILLPDCDKSQALDIAEQVRHAINDTSVTLDNGEQLILSMSFGVASYPEDADTVDKLIKAADLAVYVAKDCGRNQVKAYIESYSEGKMATFY